MSDRRIGFGTVIAGSIYGLYGWIVFGLCALIALVGVLVIPGEHRRARLTSAMARAVFSLGGVKPQIEGLENIPDGNAVLVANHASYVDGPLLKAYMPHRFSFVIKGEMRKVPIAHFLLRRSGSRFVERFESGGSARDARKIVKAALDGAALGFFPEGTFRREPGVGRFRPGAFVAAVRAGAPQTIHTDLMAGAAENQGAAPDRPRGPELRQPPRTGRESPPADTCRARGTRFV